MSKTSDIISYYRDCISVDLKAVSIDNFFGKDVSHQHILESFEHLTSSIYELPIDSVWGKELDEELILHSKEKQLYTGVFFLKGSIKRIGRMMSTFTPLYLYETFLTLEDGVYYISVDRDNPIFNPAFFEYLRYELGLSTDLQKQILNELPTGALDFDALIKTKEIFETLSEQINTGLLSDFITSDQPIVDLEKIARSRSKKYYLSIIPGAALGLAKKSKGAMGVLQELDELIHQDKSSDLLTEVFGLKEATRTAKEQQVIHTPASLSENQKKVFYSLDTNRVTLVIGPPGTGKTFTIANLAANIIGEGKSALIVCKTSQASNVVVDKIQNDLKIKGKLINATSLRYKKSIESRLNNILFSLNSRHPLHGEHDKLKKQIIDIDAKVNLAILSVVESEKEEIKWGKLYFSNKNRFVKLFFSKWIEYKKTKRESISYYIGNINKLEKSKSYKVKRYLEIRYRTLLFTILTEHRQEFATLLEAIREKTGNLIHDKFRQINFGLILKALPIWVCTANNLHNVLPFEKELFDVVIIDEATQCDIPSAIPLLYRAKKAVIVGDPKQLRHISFLSQSQEQTFRSKYSIIDSLPLYRDASILDLVSKSITRQEQVTFLNEHYRSTPSIIGFSNSHFYENSLHIMTDKPSHTADISTGLQLVSVDGQRDVKGVNEKETEAIIEYISKVVNMESGFEKKYKSSIGVLSPFRAQIDHLKKAIRARLDLNKLRHHNILIGTPYHFQGEERDIMYLSFSLDMDAHPSSLQYLNKEDVFNVSITRARKSQTIFTSLNYKHLDAKYLVSKYLNSITDSIKDVKYEVENDDNFCNEVTQILKEMYNTALVFQKYFIGSLEIDIIMVHRQNIYCIDLIGYPGDFVPMFSIETIRMLDRMGLKVLFIPYSDWKLDQKKCIKELLREIEK